MSFAHPSYLWALTGLAIPLAIHLLSRKEGKIIRVGSIRHVEESNTSQFKSIRLNEIFLLLLRILMVTILVFFISGAQWTGTNKGKKLAYLERGIAADSLVSKGYEVHELPAGNYWSFAEDLNRMPYEIVVVSYSRADDFKGERIALNENIKWITAEPKPEEFQALAWKAGDSVFVRDARSDAMQTTYRTRTAIPDSISIIEPRPVSVSSGNKFVIAALNVLRKEYKLPIQITVVDSISTFDKQFSPTDQDEAINDDLVIGLFKVLYPELQKPEVSKDVRVLPDQFAWAGVAGGTTSQLATSDGIEKYLILLFVISLAAERFVAVRRNQ